MVNRQTYKEAIINILNQKKTIDPVDFIDHFEHGGVDVKVKKLRNIIWKAVGTPVKLAVLDLILEGKVETNASGHLMLKANK